MSDWTGAAELAAYVVAESERSLRAYAAQPTYVREHVGIEANIFASGYSQRQVFELVQNAADALITGRTTGRVRVVLTKTALYCANEGAPIDANGITAILMAYLSSKKGEQIGHFGLGFKSVLSVSCTPQFFSRTVSFGFDKAQSLRRIQAVLPDVEDVPVLRLGHLLDARAEALADPILNELMNWATTVIRLPRNVGQSAWLSRELETFPSQFLVFSPHVSRLELCDDVSGVERLIEASVDHAGVTITEDYAESRWRVFHRALPVAALTQEQLDDAESATRQRTTLPLVWAVPSESSRGRGRFWAFFPTETETTLTGILNAPWKTNADRQNLLDGAFNRRLLADFVRMIARAWPELLDRNDPGSLLDLLPVRDQDAKNWADRFLGDGLYQALSAEACLPDCRGLLGRPAEVVLRPDLAASDVGRQWLAEAPRADAHGRSRWLHLTVETRDRRPRAERLGARRGSLTAWVEDVSAVRTVEASLTALALVDALWPRMSQDAVAEVKKARFVLTSDLHLAAPDRQLCLPVEGVPAPSGVSLVAAELVADASARDTLMRKLDVQTLSVDVQLELELARSAPNWTLAWALLRRLPLDRACALARQHASRLHVRTLAGTFVPVSAVLLPGAIAEPAVVADHGLIVDLGWHRADGPLLDAAGVVEGPVWGRQPEGDWYSEYLKAARAAYRTVETRSIYEGDILPAAAWQVAGPVHPLASGSDGLRLRYTAQLLPLLAHESPWAFYCRTKPKAYKTVPITAAMHWCVKRFGILDTSLGPMEPKAAVSPVLGRWGVVLPVANVSPQIGAALGLASDLAQLSDEQWAAAMEVASTLESFEDLVVCWAFFGDSCGHRPAPPTVVAFSHGRPVQAPPDRVKVTDDRDRFDALQDAAVNSILVPDRQALAALVERWSLAEASAVVNAEPSGPAEPVIDVFPGLEPFLSRAVTDVTTLQSCESVSLQITEEGQSHRRGVAFARVGSSLYYADRLERPELLDRLLTDLHLQLQPQQRAGVLSHADGVQQRRAEERVRHCSASAEKLLAAIGGEAVRRQLPTKVVTAALGRAGERPRDLALAEAAVAVFGVELLRHYRHELVAAGFAAPSQWHGGPAAAEFCERLGFPPEFAGFEQVRRDPMLEVDGPVEWKALHPEYQQPIVHRIRAFFSNKTPDRGLLSLPTGAGKTRVVVEALIGAFHDRGDSPLLIWIAQSDELCEQAVQAWAQAWRAVGRSERLRVSRLWGGTNNRVRPVSDAPHVVVATYQSLGSRLHRASYGWLKRVRCVVIDEAHGSTAASYTEILDGVGITARETPVHLIGLTATPFRGSGADEAETRWLANRYGQHRFDHDVIPGDDPYPYLQSIGVLARVEQQVMQGKNIELTSREVEHLEQYNVLPPDVEKRLGEDDARNRDLVEVVAALDQAWPVLFFATSVEHSELMAALLSMRGLSAQSISGVTDPGARRHYIREFKAGRLRVLTNYGVLTTGFDAPSVRALVIARPVYSRGLYQQMIGRGLRGPKNGGKEQCLIINVADNVAQYGGQLAFRHFEHLWKPWPGVPASI